jgi:hypothetical protein
MAEKFHPLKTNNSTENSVGHEGNEYPFMKYLSSYFQ